MGLIRPDSGVIKAEGQSLQMVFQDPHQSLDPLWNIREILKEALARASLSGSEVQGAVGENFYSCRAFTSWL